MPQENQNPQTGRSISIPTAAALVVVAAIVGAATALTIDKAEAFSRDSSGDTRAETLEAEPVPASPEHWQAEPLNDPFDLLRADEWNPFSEMQAMHERMEKIFDQSWSRLDPGSLGSAERFKQPVAASPKIDLVETDGQYLVNVDMPGLEEGDAKVSLEGKSLSISGRIEDAQDSSGGALIKRERRATQFARTMSLPGPVDASGMKTHFENGVLTISIPKAAAPTESSPL